MKLLTCSAICFTVFISHAAAQGGPAYICLDQEGYYPGAPKTAVLAIPDRSGFSIADKAMFYIFRDHTTDTVYRAALSAARQSGNSSISTRVADFSAVELTGTFRIGVAGCSNSYPFRIEAGVHHPLAVASLKAYYFMRASTALDPEYAGKWNRPAGHPDTGVFIHPSAASPKRPAGTIISTPGGWYDAGDYNKYIVNSGISMCTLLSAYEDYPDYFDSLHTHIPALNNPLPDILNEILCNLRWMLTMQDPADGGVYNKCTNARFDSMEMPEFSHERRYVVQKGTAATLDFAAVTARAARIFDQYRKTLPGLSDSCRLAAVKAWKWAAVHPALAYDQQEMNLHFDPKISTGGYGDHKFADEWFWAAAELYISTGSSKYKSVITKTFQEHFGLPSWSETGLLGYYSLINNRDKLKVRRETDTMQARLIRMADDYIQSAGQNVFLTVMGGRRSDFNWGSNANAGNQGILLLEVYRLKKDRKYLDAALGNLEYICGRNATGYCFVTGFGTWSTRHPHHRPSVADGIDDPVPGLLAGGPNPGEQDHSIYLFHEAETAYTDQEGAYASNEIAINWNAPLVYLVNAIEAEQNVFHKK